MVRIKHEGKASTGGCLGLPEASRDVFITEIESVYNF